MYRRPTSIGLALLFAGGGWLLPGCPGRRESARDAGVGCECGPRAGCVALRLQAPRQVYRTDEKIVLHAELTNVSRSPVLARKYLGIGDLSSRREVYPSWMEIYRDGQVVGWVADLPFGGIRPDRDFRTLAPGSRWWPSTMWPGATIFPALVNTGSRCTTRICSGTRHS